MTTVNNQKEFKAAIRTGETQLVAGNKRMEAAMRILATSPYSFMARIASKGIAGITPEMVVAIGISVAITLVGLAIILYNSKAKITVYNPENGKPIFTIEKK